MDSSNSTHSQLGLIRGHSHDRLRLRDALALCVLWASVMTRCNDKRCVGCGRCGRCVLRARCVLCALCVLYVVCALCYMCCMCCMLYVRIVYALCAVLCAAVLRC
jgi:hypothetical protein